MCCDYVPMAGAALCYSEGRGFEPRRGYRTGLGPGMGRDLLHGWTPLSRRPLSTAADRSEVIHLTAEQRGHDGELFSGPADLTTELAADNRSRDTELVSQVLTRHSMLEEQLVQLSCLFIMGVTRLHRGDSPPLWRSSAHRPTSRIKDARVGYSVPQVGLPARSVDHGEHRKWGA